jgi:hypothetical protein
MKLNFPSAGGGALVCIFIASLSWAHEIDIGHCDTDTFTQEVSGLKCDQKHIEFKSNGLPASGHILMEGIISTNQQFPTEHSYQFKINRKPKQLGVKALPDAGPIGVAVNGIPIFDPATQGPVNKRTGKRPSTLDAGELDKCGGHAGRGDDYHYHIAPNCLIEQLGRQKVEIEKKPIGFSMDGHPIHALGWFTKLNDIESKLDKCRGMTDLAGNYFYNVKATSPWAILDCFNSEPRRFAKDKFDVRLDTKGREVNGLPLKLTISAYKAAAVGSEICRTIDGIIPEEKILQNNGTAKRIKNESVQIFYCNQFCYGHFNEADKKPQLKGRVIFYELVTSSCQNEFDMSKVNMALVYDGPEQSYKGKQSTEKFKKPPKPR